MSKNALTDLLKMQQEWRASYGHMEKTMQLASKFASASAAGSALSHYTKIADSLLTPSLKEHILRWSSLGNAFSQQLAWAESMKDITASLVNVQRQPHLIAFQNSLLGLSKKINTRAIYQNDLTYLPAFEFINEQAKTLVSQVSTDKAATLADLDRLREFFDAGLQEIKKEVKKSGKSPLAIICFLLALISILQGIFPDALKKDGGKPATQHQLAQVRQGLIDQYQATVDEFVRRATIRIKCSIRLKPSSQSMHLFTLTPGVKISVINTNHKWANISFIDPAGNWPVTGWVLKKYLLTEKK
jgi:hypothetical protein